jgi:hypothetical protein
LIHAPKTPSGHPDRLLSCEEAMEKAFNASMDDLVAQAVAAGWGAAEAEEAVLSLAQNRRWAALANEETAGAIDEAWEEIGGKTEH